MSAVRLLLAAAAVLASWALAAAPAGAHAVLTGSVPERGAVLPESPRALELLFDEPVESALGAVRVLDAAGRRVDDGRLVAAEPTRLRTGLRPDLPEGSYTATFRVISADGHPVAGGLVFSVGAPGAVGAGVDELLPGGEAGPVLQGAAAAVRVAEYAALALGIGVLAFGWLCWHPALAEAAGAEARWRAAAAALATRAWPMLAVAAAAGVLAALASLPVEAATATGASLRESLDPALLADVAATRQGTVALAAAGAWLVIAATAAAPGGRRGVALQPAVLGAAGQAPAVPGRPARLLLAGAGLVLVALPAVGGHASTQDLPGLLVPASVLHVAAMTAWLGGLVALLGLVPAATRRLEPGDRTALLAGVLARFSTVALGAVVALLASGLAQGIVHVGRLDAIVSTGYGRALLLKAGLLAALVGLGWTNRARVLPRLRELAAGGTAAPGASGVLLRRTLRAEVGLLAAVLAVTGVLAGYAPPSTAAPGPVELRAPLGPSDLQITLDPARPGTNELHAYLFRGSDGAPSAASKELTITARQRERSIGPLELELRSAGPGHYVADRFALPGGGTWELRVTDRVSEFDQHETTLEVSIP